MWMTLAGMSLTSRWPAFPSRTHRMPLMNPKPSFSVSMVRASGDDRVKRRVEPDDRTRGLGGGGHPHRQGEAQDEQQAHGHGNSRR